MTTYKEPMAHGVSIMKFREIEVYLETLLYRGAFQSAFWTSSMGPAHWMVSLYRRDLD